MATVTRTIGEVDSVELLKPVDKTESAGVWPAGTTGAVVHDFGAHKMVEIAEDQPPGATLDLIVVPESDLRLLAKHPI